MEIRRAVITAAGPGQRTLPLQQLVDRDGEPKSVLRILCDEVVAAGIEQVAVVLRPGDEVAYLDAARDAAAQVVFVEQDEPSGYGQALCCARGFVDGEPFLHMVSDHLFVGNGDLGCARQLVEVAAAEEAIVSAVQATREHVLPRYGTVGGRRVAGRERLYEVQHVVEKPTPTEAEQKLFVSGLRTGHYLCFFGMHVLSSSVLEWLERRLGDGGGGGTPGANVGLSEALDDLAQRERVLAYEVEGTRYDVGAKYGLFAAQLALGLSGCDRERVLAQLVEVFMQRESGRE